MKPLTPKGRPSGSSRSQKGDDGSNGKGLRHGNKHPPKGPSTPSEEVLGVVFGG